jgi:hypothetical protein
MFVIGAKASLVLIGVLFLGGILLTAYGARVIIHSNKIGKDPGFKDFWLCLKQEQAGW